MNTIKFNCHQCQQPIEIDAAQGGNGITCPTCGTLVIVPLREERASSKKQTPAFWERAADKFQTWSPTHEAPSIKEAAQIQIRTPKTEADSIKDAAQRITGIGILSGVIGGFCFLAALTGGDNSMDCIIAAGGFAGFAITLTFLAQLFHIRALLARK